MLAEPPVSLVGVLLAGGQARRMGGGDKCLLTLGGEPLLAHAIRRMRPRLGTLILNANGDPARFAEFGLTVVPDPIPGYAGPLAGILAGMTWAAANRPDAPWVATAATDTPFFPHDLVPRLAHAAVARNAVAVARSDAGLHPVFGVFPVAAAGDLSRFIETSGSLKVRDWLDTREVVAVDFRRPAGGPDPFFNVNTPADLAEAETLLQRSRPI